MVISSLVISQILAAFLFTMGCLIVMFRKNSLIVLLGIELILNACNLALVSFSHEYGLIEGQIQTFFIITIAAAESAIGLSILLNLYRNFGGIKTSDPQILRG